MKVKKIKSAKVTVFSFHFIISLILFELPNNSGKDQKVNKKTAHIIKG